MLDLTRDWHVVCSEETVKAPQYFSVDTKADSCLSLTMPNAMTLGETSHI